MEPLRDGDPRTIGGYSLLCRIGSGGMGRVYLGESAAGQQVAVKVIKPSVLDEDTRARFVAEVDSLKTVYGPFVAAFVAADAEADRPWLAVEYVPGPDLRAYVTAHGPLPLVETASLGALLAEGLATVHDAGLLHRDLKPQNILLGEYGPKVIDFGLAVLAERRSLLTAPGFVVGSVQCMPPEQAGGSHDLTPAADVYALGAVLLYAATGHYPYTGESWLEVAQKIENPGVRPDLTGLPSALEEPFTRMLAQVPDDRPPLARVVGDMVAVIRGRGLRMAQAKRLLTDRVPAIEVPDTPGSGDPGVLGGHGDASYSPALVDVFARADDDVPGTGDRPGPEPGAVSTGAVPAAPIGTGHDGPSGEASRRDVWRDPSGDASRGDGPSGNAGRPPGEHRRELIGAGAGRASGSETLGVGQGHASRGALDRLSVPLRIAEHLRAAYAREAHF